MLPSLDLGPVTLPTAGLVYILCVWLALTVIERAAGSLRLNVAATYNVATIGLAVALVTARLFFVAQHWEAYRQNLLGIIWPLNSGFSTVPGLTTGATAALFYARAKRLPAWPTLDALLPGLLVTLLAVSLADFAAGPGFGKQAELLWSIDLFGVRRHPVQLYEIAAAGLAVVAWNRTRRTQHTPGHPTLLAAAVYSAARLFTDAYRANTPLTDGGYHLVQIASLGILLISLFLLTRRAPAAELPTRRATAG
jgi:phosphatidylglycerol---prolipoprotein diacylglyceryl transferase